MTITDVTDAPNLPLNDMVKLLRPHGHFVYVGVPEEDSIPKLHPFDIIMCASPSHSSHSIISICKQGTH